MEQSALPAPVEERVQLPAGQAQEPGLRLRPVPAPLRELSMAWLPAEELRGQPVSLLHSPELLASSSYILPPQKESSERMLLPDFEV
jgi:hypothetical protein